VRFFWSGDPITRPCLGHFAKGDRFFSRSVCARGCSDEGLGTGVGKEAGKSGGREEGKVVSALPRSVCYHTSEEGGSATEEDREGERGNKTQLPHAGKEKLPHSGSQEQFRPAAAAVECRRGGHRCTKIV
jgi:hypothetical protein